MRVAPIRFLLLLSCIALLAMVAVGALDGASVATHPLVGHASLRTSSPSRVAYENDLPSIRDDRVVDLLQSHVRLDRRGDDDDDYDVLACFYNLTLTQWEEVIRCSKAYWNNQVYPRTTDTWAANCFDENMIAAALHIETVFGKAQVMAGWGQVSTADLAGNPYFENNTAINITYVGWGCTENGDPFVEVNLQREFYDWTTGAYSLNPYLSTFVYRHNSNNHTAPEVGVPDYTIAHLTYMPNMLKHLAHGASQPMMRDPVAENHACNYLNSACYELVDWSPHANCWQWMENNDYTGPQPFLDYSTPGVPFTQMCVYFMAELNKSPQPRTTFCPALALCTGNFVPPPSSFGRRIEDVATQRNVHDDAARAVFDSMFMTDVPANIHYYIQRLREIYE